METKQSLTGFLPALMILGLAVSVASDRAQGAEIWVTNMKAANVEVFDPETLDRLATIPADKGAHNVTFSRDGKWAFIANVGAGNATIIDAEAKKAVATVAAGSKAHEVSVSPDGRLAAASNVGTDFVTLIDVAAGQPLRNIKTADGAMMSVFSPDGAKLYVANAKAASISVVDVSSSEVTDNWPGAKGMMAFVPTPDWNHAWATAPVDDKLIQIDLAEGARIAEIVVPGEPHGMVMSPDGTRLYVVQRKLNQVAVVDPNKRQVLKTAPLGKRPDMVAIAPDGSTLFVVSRDENKLYKVSTKDLAIQGEVATSEEPHGIAYRR